jgi:hypothetical protein
VGDFFYYCNETPNKNMKINSLFAIFFSLACYQTKAQTSIGKIPYTNGEVKALASYGDTVFVGGNFTEVNSYEKSSFGIAYFDTTNLVHIPIKVHTNGTIKKIIRDENQSGFYVAGDFTTVGDSLRSGIAHIDALGNVTSRLSKWRMNTPNINDLQLYGDTLFAAGSSLNNIYPASAIVNNYFHGISTQTELINSNKLPIVDGGTIKGMITDPTGARYIYGNFTKVNGEERYKLAKIDSAGKLLPWQPLLSRNYPTEVWSLYLNGDKVIVAGAFTELNGDPRVSVAEVDTVTGVNTSSLNFKLNRFGTTPTVYAMVKWQNTLIISGNFTAVGDSIRSNIAAIDLSTFRATSININVSNYPTEMIVDGNNLYIGGNFSVVNGNQRTALASVDLITGNVGTLNITASSLSATNYTTQKLVLSGTTLYAAVNVSPISNPQNVTGLIAVNLTNNTLINQYTIPNGQSISSLLLANNTLYITGNFENISANQRFGLASINTTTGLVNNSFLSDTKLSGNLIGKNNDQLLISGTNNSFYQYFNNKQKTTGVLAFHTTSDSLFVIPHQIIGDVNTMLISNDTLLVGGAFTLYGRNRGNDSTRLDFAAIKLSTYDILSTNIGSVNGSVNAMVKWNNAIIVGGSFANHPSGIFGINLLTSAVTTYNRAHNNGYVTQMCLYNNQLFLAGSFGLTNGYSGLISTSALPNGANTTWSTSFSSTSSIAFYQNRLYAVGTYYLNGNNYTQLRAFSIPANLTTTAPVLISARSQDITYGTCYSILGVGNRIITAGNISYQGSLIKTRGFFAYQKSTGKVIYQNFNLNNTGEITTLVVYQNSLFIGGMFDSINQTFRRNLAQLNLTTGQLTAYNPIANSSITAFHIVDNTLFVGGGFNLFNSQVRHGLASVNLSTLALNTWSPLGAGSGVSGFTSNSNSIFVYGGFSTFNSKPVGRIFNIKRGTLELDTTWNPSAQNSSLNTIIYSAEATENDVYLLFYSPSQNKLAKVNLSTGLTPVEWKYPSISTFAKKIALYKSGVIAANYLVDTNTGNVVTLQNFPYTASAINALLLQGDNLMLGGLVGTIGVPQATSLYELNLQHVPQFRLTASSYVLCKGRDYLMYFENLNIGAKGNYIISLQGNVVGVLSIPSKTVCNLNIPTNLATGNNYELRIVEETGKHIFYFANGINLGNLPIKNLQLSQSTSLCQGQRLAINITDSTNKSTYKYNWYKNDSVMSGATNYRIDSIVEAGNYKARIETEIGCADTTNVVSVTHTGLCQAPAVGASNLRFKNITTNSVTLFWRNGNGSNRVVLAKADSIITANPVYGKPLFANNEFGSGDSLNFKTYCVYNGSSNECIVTGLTPGKTYYFSVIEYNQTGAATSYTISLSAKNNITIPTISYYNKATGALNNLATWGTNTDGSGTAPSSFNIPAVYYVRNGTTPTLTSDLLLDSTSSALIIGGGSSTPPLQLLVPTTNTLSCGTVNLNGNHVLNVTGTLKTNFLSASDTSLVIFNSSNSQQIPNATVGRLTIQGGEKVMLGALHARDTFRLEAILSSTQDTFTLGTQFFPNGNLVRTSGHVVAPMKRWIRNIITTGTNGLLPIGVANRYTPIHLNLTSAPTGIGNVLVAAHFIGNVPSSGGLPLTENAITLNTVGFVGYWRLLNTNNRADLTFNLVVNVINYPGVSNFINTSLVTRNLGGNWQIFGTTPINGGSNSNFTITKNNVSAFGEFAIAGNSAQNPLPIELLYLNAKEQNGKALLTWVTSSELNNSHFDVERSIDGVKFTKVGEVAGSGNSNTVKTYRFVDELTNAKVTYYRLKQVDFNGDFTYSNVINLNSKGLNATSTISIYPNPASSSISIDGLTEQAFIYDAVGRMLLTITENGLVDINHLTPGVYFVKTNTETVKFIKQ